VIFSFACATGTPIPPDVQVGQNAMTRAEKLEADGKYEEAATLYESIPSLVRSTRGRDPARALVRAADLRATRLSQPARAEEHLWTVLGRYPDTAPADDALRMLVRAGPAGLADKLLALAERVPQTEVADNLRFEAAVLVAGEDSIRARRIYEELAKTYPKSPLRDISLYRAAEIARAARDLDGALLDLRYITSRRRDSFLVGTFNSTWLDDAQILTGRIHLEDRRDFGKAVAAFEHLRDDMTESTLRDDAQMWIVRTHVAAADSARACAAIERLRKQFPESRHLRREAPEVAKQIGCPR
jgi:TolA-binding protein